MIIFIYTLNSFFFFLEFKIQILLGNEAWRVSVAKYTERKNGVILDRCGALDPNIG